MTQIYTECPYCKEEIFFGMGEKILIGEEGEAKCPSCLRMYDFEIRVLTTQQEPRCPECDSEILPSQYCMMGHWCGESLYRVSG